MSDETETDKVPACVECGHKPEGLTEGMSAVSETAVDPGKRNLNDHVPAVNSAGEDRVWVCPACREALHAPEGTTVRVCHHKLRVTRENADSYTLYGEVGGVHQNVTVTKSHVHQQLRTEDGQ